MNKPKEETFNKEETQPTRRKVEYQPPDKEVFEQLAKRFCETLSERGDLTANTEVVVGLAEFLTVIARLTAKSLSNDEVKVSEITRPEKETGKGGTNAPEE